MNDMKNNNNKKLNMGCMPLLWTGLKILTAVSFVITLMFISLLFVIWFFGTVDM